MNTDDSTGVNNTDSTDDSENIPTDETYDLPDTTPSPRKGFLASLSAAQVIGAFTVFLILVGAIGISAFKTEMSKTEIPLTAWSVTPDGQDICTLTIWEIPTEYADGSASFEQSVANYRADNPEAIPAQDGLACRDQIVQK